MEGLARTEPAVNGACVNVVPKPLISNFDREFLDSLQNLEAKVKTCPHSAHDHTITRSHNVHTIRPVH